MTIASLSRGPALASVSHRRPASAAALASPLLWASVYLAAIALHLSVSMPGDVSWLITVGERMLDGQRLYVDISETNPPMSAWIYLPWIWLARLCGAAPELVITLAVLAFVWFTTEAASRTLVRVGLIAENRVAWRLVAAFAFAIAPISTFAQREHVAILAFLPLIACLASRAGGRAPDRLESLMAGVLGGLAVAIKPHFALGVLLPALGVAVRLRSLRPLFAPECLVAAAVSLAYVAVAAILHPAYLLEVLPLAAAVYVPNRLSLEELLFSPEFIGLSIEVFGILLLRRDFASGPLGATLLAAMVGFALAYLVQGKGWLYHLLPAWTLAVLAFGLALDQRPAFWRVEGIKRPLICAVLIYIVIAPMGEYAAWRDAYRPLMTALEPLGPKARIALLTDSLKLTSPLHRDIGGILVTRGPSLWVTGNATALARKETSPERLSLYSSEIGRERELFRTDVLASPPDVFLVEKGSYDWLDWARRDAALAALLDRYRKISTVRIGPVAIDLLTRAPDETSYPPELRGMIEASGDGLNIAAPRH